MRLLRSIALLALVVLVALPLAPTAASEGPPLKIDGAEECTIQDEFSSFRLGFSGITDDGATITLEVLVLRHGVTRRAAAEVMAKVDRMYRPLNIELAVTSRPLLQPVEESIRDVDLIELSKDAVEGTRPDGIDVVYTLTTSDLTDSFQTNATAGRADCIGGVRYPHRAFAVGEYMDDVFVYPPFTFMEDEAAKIAAHEIGHLLGAAHEYANCAEGSDMEPTQDALGICSVMFNDLGLIGSRFSTIEGAVARAYAVDFASP